MRQLTQSELGEIDGLEELADLSFDGLRLAGHDFADRVIEDCSFRGCILADARFNASTLRRCQFQMPPSRERASSARPSRSAR